MTASPLEGVALAGDDLVLEVFPQGGERGAVSGDAHHEIAVLFRSSYHSFDLEMELNKRNLPFVKVGKFAKQMSSPARKGLLEIRRLTS